MGFNQGARELGGLFFLPEQGPLSSHLQGSRNARNLDGNDLELHERDRRPIQYGHPRPKSRRGGWLREIWVAASI